MSENREKHECQELFLKHFKMEEKDLHILQTWFIEYGLMKNHNDPKSYRNNANHKFLQQILEEFVVSWKEWGEDLTPELRTLIENSYPQLMTDNIDFEW